ncbi:MAG TPA: energy transducer TonB [Vicinamibacterales bacterium]|nr:energy transducer TonB [Vicinamibacterales bacterium]
MSQRDLPDVYSAREIARAAGVRLRDVRDLEASGVVRSIDGRFFTAAEAVAAVRALGGVAASPDRPLFRPAAGWRREPALPIAASGTLHAAMLGGLLLLTTIGIAKPEARVALQDRKDLSLVFLVAPGPGGGGGGGGRREAAPPPPAERQGLSTLRSPIPVKHSASISPSARAVPPPRVDPPVVQHVEPPAKPDPLPPVVAPVVAVAADPRDRAGIPWTAKDTAPAAESQGPGAGGGTGSGHGTGVGEGEGAGIGAGSNGGTGGGPYRPGSGITAPTIQREVKPDYTEEGRRRNLEGDVVLEIVVRSDGSVGSVKLLQGLGAGLDQRASDAVRQWRFNPARRYGVPVDVIVEVAVEFKLR